MKTRHFIPIIFLLLFCQISIAQKSAKIEMPFYPPYKNVMEQFFKSYTFNSNSGEIILSLYKKPDGWHAAEVNYIDNKPIKDELFWSRKENKYLKLEYEKNELGEINSADSNLIQNNSAIIFSLLVPYWGYNGWENDVIKDFAGKKNLSDSLLNAVARAYSSYAKSLIGSSEFGDSEKYQKIPKGQNALNSEILAKYLENQHLSVENYYKLFKQNPKFESFVSDIYNIYSNEIMNCFLTLRYYQNEETAKKELKKGLYDNFYIEMAKNYLSSCDKNAILFTNGDMDTYPLIYVQENENFRKDVLVVNVSLLNLGRYTYQLTTTKSGAIPLKTGMDPEIYNSEKKLFFYIYEKYNIPLSMKEILGFITSDDQSTKLQLSDNQFYDYIPSKNIYFNIAENIKKEYPNQLMDSSINITLKKNYLTIAEFCILDIIAANNFERPVYFATTVGSDNFLGFENYFSQEGLAYKITPIKTENQDQYNPGIINSDILYSRLFNNLHFDKANFQKTEKTNNHKNMINLYRAMFSRLANQLVTEGKNDKALSVLDYCVELFPIENATYNFNVLDFIQNYFKIGQEQKAKALLTNYIRISTGEIEKLINSKKSEANDYEIRVKVYIINELLRICEEFIPNDNITKDLKKTCLQYQSYNN